MTVPETQKLIAVFKAAYPGWRPERDTADAWQMILGDLPYDQVNGAAMAWMRNPNIWPPAPGVLRESVLNLAAPRQLGADEAWAEAIRRASSIGRNGDPGDDLVGQACRMVGWKNLCLAPVDSYPSLRAHFREIYRGEADRLHQYALQSPGFKALSEGRERLESAEEEIDF